MSILISLMHSRTYDNSISAMTDNIQDAIILEYILEKWNREGRQEFFAFLGPTNHPFYKEAGSLSDHFLITPESVLGSLEQLQALGLIAIRSVGESQLFLSIESDAYIEMRQSTLAELKAKRGLQ